MNDWAEEQVLDEKERADIVKAMVWLWLMWGVLLAMQVMFVVMAHVLRSRIEVQGETSKALGLPQLVLGVVSAVSLGIAWYLRRSYVRRRFGLLLNAFGQLAAVFKMPAHVVKCQAAICITMAIPSSVVIYGFVLYILGATSTVFYGFVVVSVLAVIWLRPKRSELIPMCRREKAGSTDLGADA
jgi:hypothetical protein